VLKDLESAGLVARAPGLADRRERRLLLTPAGREAERAVTTVLRDRLSLVLRAAGGEAVAGARAVLAALADSGEEV
jgi:DNA-binding MarR family transcriptional regulator